MGSGATAYIIENKNTSCDSHMFYKSEQNDCKNPQISF